MITRDAACLIYQQKFIDKNDIPNLYHYTSTMVLDALLKECTFRASNIFYLNDSEEYKAGIKALLKLRANNAKTRKILENLLHENGKGINNEGLFTVSFSQESDILSQWTTYAKEGGVAIELDIDLIKEYGWYGVEKSCQSIEYSKFKPADLFSFQLQENLHEIIYDYRGIDYSKIYAQDCPDQESFMWIASYFKTEGFSPEKEIRISVFPVQHDKDENNKAAIKYHYMNGRGVLRPYLDIIFGYVDDLRTGLFTPCLPLKTITVGPAGNQQAVFNSVVHRLKFGNSQLFDYSKCRLLLDKNVIAYIVEILKWLYAKGYITSFLETKNEIKDDNINILINNQVEKEEDKQLVQYYVEYVIKRIEKNMKIKIGNYIKAGITEFDTDKLRVLREIDEDFYFSKEGVLVKKSGIPYIYT